jgi:hypothetical protein
MNAASYSPLPLSQQAGVAAVGRKATPWTLDTAFANREHERERADAAHLINANPEDIALISSISYGVATAAQVLAIARGSRVIVLENDHSSPVLEFHHRRGPPTARWRLDCGHPHGHRAARRTG